MELFIQTLESVFVLSRVKKQQEEVTLERYHGPLITNGVELGHIKIVPWLNLIFSSLFYIFNSLMGYDVDSEFVKRVFLIWLCIDILSIVYSFFDSIIVKHQVFTYILLIINFVNLLFSLNYMGFILATSAEGTGNFFSSNLFVMGNALLITLISLIMTFFVYPYFYRRDRLTNGAYREKESKFNSEDNKLFSSNFLIIFGLVVFVPPLLTGYLENVFGLVIGILFSLVFPALVVDAFYAALYAKQHPEEIDEL